MRRRRRRREGATAAAGRGQAAAGEEEEGEEEEEEVDKEVTALLEGELKGASSPLACFSFSPFLHPARPLARSPGRSQAAKPPS